MANTYTDSYAGVSSALVPEAEKMCSALNNLEKVEHKISAEEWAENKNSEKSSEIKYPSCAAVQKAIDEAQVNPVTDPNNFPSNHSKPPSAGAVYRFMKSKEESIEKMTNIVTAAQWEANKTSETRYPSCPAVKAAISKAAIALAQIISGASTNTQIPSAKAVWDFWQSNIWRLNVDFYAGKNVKLRKFEIEKSFAYDGSGGNWYEAVRLSVAATLSAGDVPQSVKNHINTTWGGDNISNDNCLAYLRYAHKTPGVWRLPTEAEWGYAMNNSMFGYTNQFVMEWCCDAFDSSPVNDTKNPVNWGANGSLRVIRNSYMGALRRGGVYPNTGGGYGGNDDIYYTWRFARTAIL
jgi:hypothetical protein